MILSQTFSSCRLWTNSERKIPEGKIVALSYKYADSPFSGINTKKTPLTNLTQACFLGTDLSFSTFEGAKLIRTELMEANLGGANMTGANDGGAWYESAFFCDTTLPDRTFLEGSHLVED